MRKSLKRILSGVLTAAMLFTSAVVAPVTTSAASFSKVGGWYESIYAEINGVKDAQVTKVEYSGPISGSLTGNDLEFLVRDSSNGVRIDIPGLKAGSYSLTVTANGTAYTRSGIKVEAHDRSGYAHWNYNQGIGAYNNDGTLKDNAIVVYVTDKNKDTVEVPGYEGRVYNYNPSSGSPYTRTTKGVGDILNNNNQFIREITGTDNHPLVIRFIGKINPPKNLTPYNAKDPALGGSTGDNGNLAITKYAKNVTLEGIGEDAEIYGWGFTFSQTSTCPADAGIGFEVSNLTFRNYPEDALGFQGDDAIDCPIQRVWVHNNTFYPGYANPSAASDKKEGDGSCDFKRGQYYTMSYNHYINCHKTNLLGSSEKIDQFYMTLHHNWYEDVQSRQPLGAGGNTHIYNTLFEDNGPKSKHNSSQVIDLRGYSSTLAENNYFYNCKNYYNTRHTTTCIKLFNNITVEDTFADSGNKGKVTLATSRTQSGLPDNGLKMPDGGSIKDWDMNQKYFYCDSKGNTQVSVFQDPADVPAFVKSHAGTMQALPVSESATINVTVTDSNNKAVTDATVTANGMALSHSGNGVYSASVAVGVEYEIKVSKEGYSNVTLKTGELSDGQTYNGTAKLVADTDGLAAVYLVGGSEKTPVTGATIKLDDGQTLKDQGDGNYVSAKQVSLGNHTVTITNTGDYVAPTTPQTIVVKTTDEATEIHLNKIQGAVSVTLVSDGSETLDASAATVTVGSTQLSYAGNNKFTGSVDINTELIVDAKLAGWKVVSINPAKLTAAKSGTVSSTVKLTKGGDEYVWNKTDDINTEDFFDITANNKSGATTQVFEGMELTAASKMESSTSIKFNAPAAGTLVMVFDTGSAKIKLNGETITITSGVPFNVPAGAVEITKGDTLNFYYLRYAVGDSGSTTPTPPETSTETTTETPTEAPPVVGDDTLAEGSYVINKANAVTNHISGIDADSNHIYSSDSSAVKVRDDGTYIGVTPSVTGTLSVTWSSNAPKLLDESGNEVSTSSTSSPYVYNVTAGKTYKITGTKTGGNSNISNIELSRGGSAEPPTETTTETVTDPVDPPTPSDTVKLSVDDVTAKVSDGKVTVPVNIKDASVLGIYTFGVKYNNAVLTPVAAKAGSAANSVEFEANLTDDGNIEIAAVNSDANNAASDGVLVYIEFAIKAAGTSDIELNDVRLYSGDDSTTLLDATYSAGKVTVEQEQTGPEEPVEPTLLGDVDLDGDIDRDDAILALKYVAGIVEIGNGITEQGVANADFYTDGKVDKNDVIAILKYISGGSEESGLTPLEEGTYNAAAMIGDAGKFKVFGNQSEKEVKISEAGFVQFSLNDGATVEVTYKCGSTDTSKTATVVLNGQTGTVLKGKDAQTTLTVSGLSAGTYKITAVQTGGTTANIVSIKVTYNTTADTTKETTTETTTTTTTETTTTTTTETTTETTTSAPSAGEDTLPVGSYTMNKDTDQPGLDISNSYSADSSSVKLRGEETSILVTPGVTGTLSVTWSSKAPILYDENGNAVSSSTSSSPYVYNVTAGKTYKIVGSNEGSNTTITNITLSSDGSVQPEPPVDPNPPVTDPDDVGQLPEGDYDMNKSSAVTNTIPGIDTSNIYSSDSSAVKVRGDGTYIAVTPAISGTLSVTWSSNAPVLLDESGKEVSTSSTSSPYVYSVTAGKTYKITGSKATGNSNIENIVLSSGNGGSTETPTETTTSAPVSGKYVAKLDVSSLTAETITSSKSLGSDGFSVIADSSNSIVVESNSQTADDNTSYTQRLKLGGTGSTTKRAIKFTTTGSGTLTVYAMSASGTADRTLNLLDSSGTVKGSSTAYGASIIKQTIAIPKADTYYLVSASSGINIYFLGTDVALKDGSSTEKPSETTTSAPVSGGYVATLNASDLAEETISSSKSLGNGFTITADSTNTVVIDTSSKSVDGYNFTKRIKLSGTGTTAKRSIKFETTGKGTLSIYALSSSSSAGRTVNLLNSSGTSVGEITADGSTLTKQTIAIPSAGVYYLGASGGGANVYFLGTDVALKDSGSSEKPSETTTSNVDTGVSGPMPELTKVPSNTIKTITSNSESDLKDAIKTANSSGGTIVIDTPTIKVSGSSSLTLSGTKTAAIVGKQQKDGTYPVLDFSGLASGKQGIQIKGDNKILQNLIIEYAPDNGVLIDGGSKNTIEHCIARYNGDTGIQTKNESSDNVFRYCYAYRNVDISTYGGNADGFAPKLGSKNARFEYCYAWDNSDDGWDSFDKGDDLAAKVSYLHSACWNNGNTDVFSGKYDYNNGAALDEKLPTIKDIMASDSSFKSNYNNKKYSLSSSAKIGGKAASTWLSTAEGEMNGNGFKFGSANTAKDPKVQRIADYSIAFNHKSKGFDNNNTEKCTGYITNCVSFGNNINYQLPYTFASWKNNYGWGALKSNQSKQSETILTPSMGTSKAEQEVNKIKDQIVAYCYANKMPDGITFDSVIDSFK